MNCELIMLHYYFSSYKQKTDMKQYPNLTIIYWAVPFKLMILIHSCKRKLWMWWCFFTKVLWKYHKIRIKIILNKFWLFFCWTDDVLLHFWLKIKLYTVKDFFVALENLHTKVIFIKLRFKLFNIQYQNNDCCLFSTFSQLN